MSAGDPKTARAPRGQGGVLNQLVAGQAANQQRLEELFRRIDRAEETAGEPPEVDAGYTFAEPETPAEPPVPA